MIGFDQLLRILTAGHILFAARRAISSRLSNRSPIKVRLKGPFIQPPQGNETQTASDLWEITSAFREAVVLGLAGKGYTTNQRDVISLSCDRRSLTDAASYDLSLRPSPDLLPSCRNNYASDHSETSSSRWEGEDEATDHAVSYEAALAPTPTSNFSEVRICVPAANYFSSLRSLFGLSDETFHKAILDSGLFVSFATNSKGAARTGTIFFFTGDGKYLIKSIKKDEATALLKMLPKYRSHMESNGKLSLLTRFYGLYEIDIVGKHLTFVIMNSVFPAVAADRITERFDLKGSTLGRKCPDLERKSKGMDAVLKDLDVLQEVYDGNLRDTGVTPGFVLGPETKTQLIEQLSKDVSFLRQCSVIDYSLLVGIAPIKRSWTTALRRRRLTNLSTLGGMRRGHPATYYLGLIDFLQPFNGKKIVEYNYKSLLHRNETFSCVPPRSYAQRFISFLQYVVS